VAVLPGLPNPNFKNQEFLCKKPGVDQEISDQKTGEKPGGFYRNHEMILRLCFEENCNFC
jgi:hypothetical protein